MDMPILSQILRNIQTLNNQPCWRFKDDSGWRTVTWQEMATQVHRLAAWLRVHGLQPGERVALWSSTRWEWSLVDLAVLVAGGVTVPVYHTLPVEQTEVLVREPECRFLFTERPYHPQFANELAALQLPLRHIVWFDAVATVGAIAGITLASILSTAWAGESAGEAAWNARDESQLASIVYTSGTTGTPKGVELTLANFRAEIAGLTQALPFQAGDECLMFLPLAHIVARAVQFFQLCQGCVGVYAESMDRLGQNIQDTRPHFFVGVPRVFEKIQARLLDHLAHQPRWKQRVFAWALEVGKARGKYQQQHRSVPWGIRCKAFFARWIVRPVQARFGGRLRLVISGGAPLGKEVAEFFDALGLTILEGYGLTETTAAVTINRPDDYRFGSVGKPLAGVQVHIAEDGEVMVKSPTIFRGYYQRPQDTDDVISREGWFHTGDIGEFTRDGFLRITDRKKDLIKTSGGKFIAPQPIENALKQSPYISDAVVHGDREKFLTALITLDRPTVERFAEGEGLAIDSWSTIIQHPRVVGLVQRVVDDVNQHLARWETIKRFSILERDFAIENGELTPTLKVRRKITYQRYKKFFDQMYQAG